MPLAVAHARAGERDKARALLDELHGMGSNRYIPPSWFALIHMNLGEMDRAFEWLDRALEARALYLLHLKVSPLYDPVRGDPRYQDLVLRMNFPQRDGV